jgi:hypothetical protein
MGDLRAEQRRSIAVLTCVLWLLAVEVLPAIHLAGHDDHHTHADDGAIRALEQHFAAHEAGIAHDDHALELRAPKRRAPRPDGQLAIGHAPYAHAAAGIAHHAIALHRPTPPLVAPLPVAPIEWRTLHVVEAQLASAALAHPNARGPPARG